MFLGDRLLAPVPVARRLPPCDPPAALHGAAVQDYLDGWVTAENRDSSRRTGRRRTVRQFVPRSRCLVVVAQEAAQAFAATNSGAADRAGSRRNQVVVEALMIPLLMVVHHELPEHV
jgi:hypothetical protein